MVSTGNLLLRKLELSKFCRKFVVSYEKLQLFAPPTF